MNFYAIEKCKQDVKLAALVIVAALLERQSFHKVIKSSLAIGQFWRPFFLIQVKLFVLYVTGYFFRSF